MEEGKGIAEYLICSLVTPVGGEGSRGFNTGGDEEGEGEGEGEGGRRRGWRERFLFSFLFVAVPLHTHMTSIG